MYCFFPVPHWRCALSRKYAIYILLLPFQMCFLEPFNCQEVSIYSISMFFLEYYPLLLILSDPGFFLSNCAKCSLSYGYNLEARHKSILQTPTYTLPKKKNDLLPFSAILPPLNFMTFSHTTFNTCHIHWQCAPSLFVFLCTQFCSHTLRASLSPGTEWQCQRWKPVSSGLKFSPLYPHFPVQPIS